MDPILSFYLGFTDDHHRTLKEILSWEDSKLEEIHNWIQWVLPIKTTSKFNNTAPMLTDETIKILINNKDQLYNIFFRFIKYLNLDQDYPFLITRYNHNYLRITRFLLWMHEMQFSSQEIDRVYFKLESYYYNFPELIGLETFAYWKLAKNGKYY
mgnify:FL=1